MLDSNLPNKDAWWEDYAKYIPDTFKTFLQTEHSTTEIRTYCAYRISGLLQTENYAVSSFNACFPKGNWNELEAKKRLQVRLIRQKNILHNPNRPKMRFILDETLLYRQLGGLEVLREQLLHLLKLATLPQVEIRILPLTHSIDHLSYGFYGFILNVPAGNTVPGSLYSEHSTSFNTDEFTEDKFKVEHYSILFDRLWKESLDQDQTFKLIKNAEQKLV